MSDINTGSTDNQEQVESSVDEIEGSEITDKMEALVNSPSVDEQESVSVSESNLVVSKVTQMEEDVLIPIKSEMSDNPNHADMIENGGSDLESMMEIKDDCIEEQGDATAEVEPQPKTAARPSHFRNGHVVSDLHMWYVQTKVREQYQEEYDRPVSYTHLTLPTNREG